MTVSNEIENSSENQKSRCLYLSTKVDNDPIIDLIKAIHKINTYDDEQEAIASKYNGTYQRKPIQLYINSYGGYVYDMFALIGAIESSKTEVYTYATGKACSAAFVILLSGKKRFAYKHSSLMYHSISSCSFGTTEQIRVETKSIEALQERCDNYILSKTKFKQKHLDKYSKASLDYWMFPEEALQYGVIDEII